METSEIKKHIQDFKKAIIDSIDRIIIEGLRRKKIVFDSIEKYKDYIKTNCVTEDNSMNLVFYADGVAFLEFTKNRDFMCFLSDYCQIDTISSRTIQLKYRYLI